MWFPAFLYENCHLPYDSLPSIPIGQFSFSAEFSTQQGLSSPLQPFSVLVPDWGQGMWEDGGWWAVVWTVSWRRRGWKTSTAMNVHKWAVSKPVLIILSDLEVLSLPCARELAQLHYKLGSPYWGSLAPTLAGASSHWGMHTVTLNTIAEMFWGRAAHQGGKVVLWYWVHKSSGKLLTERLWQTVKDALHSLFSGSALCEYII